jgi:hypothetical protein
MASYLLQHTHEHRECGLVFAWAVTTVARQQRSPAAARLRRTTPVPVDEVQIR